jgi:hypothetical protein
VVIVGWLRTFTVLGMKIEECRNCGATCDHVVGRKVNWGTLFWIPLLFLGFTHGMLCTGCGHWTGIPFLKVREAMRSGQLALPRERPAAQQLLAASVEEGQPPLNATAVYDTMLVNPRRGAMDIYLKAYPFIIGGLVLAVALATALRPPPPVTVAAPAHTCWVNAAGEVTGCKLVSGEVVGTTTTNATVTCRFAEPVTESTNLNCDND